MKILAVDDDPVFLAVLRENLRSIGCLDVEELTSPTAALAYILRRKDCFDCILLDVEMPDLNGIQLCGRIRSIEGYRHTPIVMITSRSDRTSIDNAFALGATDYLTKPLDQFEVKARLGMIKRVVEEHQRARELESQLKVQKIAATFQFDTPINVPDFDRGMEYLAFQNYLLTIGLRKLYSIGVVAITVSNAATFYRIAGPEAFRAMLGDVGSVIQDFIKTERMLISYAGSGHFVGILDSQAPWLPDELELSMNAAFEEYKTLYDEDRLPLPVVRVGEIVGSSPLPPARPAHLIERAISSAKRDRVQTFGSAARGLGLKKLGRDVPL